MTTNTATLSNSILIVDDDIEALEEMAEALQECGLAVHTASDVYTALKLASQHRPEFILMDYLLRGTTGVDVASAIREFLPGVQVIMISAFEDLNRIVNNMNSGAIAVLQKPLSMDSIGRFIGNQLEHKKQQLRSLKQ